MAILLTAVICIALAILAPQTAVNPSEPQIPAQQVGNMSSVVRLHDPSTGRFFCSGVVINSKLIATAAHCVVESNPVGEIFGIVNKRATVNVRGADGKDIGLIAKVDGAHVGSDQAILSGNFSRFSSLPLVDKVSEDLALLLDNRRLLIACGYPYGAELFCVEVTSRIYYSFAIQGKSYLFPGMSGGPVIDVQTGKVLALNRAVGGTDVYVSPTMGIFNNTSRDK